MANINKYKSHILFYYLFILCSTSNIAQGHGWELTYPNGMFSSRKQVLANKDKEVAQVALLRKKKIHRNARFTANSMIACSTGMLLKGNFAFPSLILSTIASKIVVETNADLEQGDMGSFLCSISFIFSGVAALNGWLLKRVNLQPKDAPLANNETSCSSDRTLNALLLLGSRGMELTGGTILLLIQILQHGH